MNQDRQTESDLSNDLPDDETLDRWIRQADPGSSSRSVEMLRDHWGQCVNQRRKRKRLVANVAWVTAACLAVVDRRSIDLDSFGHKDCPAR
ncbi:MAG: hypothetical protein R3C05_18895 [Pirellulaceae bacterium]